MKRKDPAAVALGRKGGNANSPKQQIARSANATKLGLGRPRRVCNACGMPVHGGHKDRALDATCGPHGWHWEAPGNRKG